MAQADTIPKARKTGPDRARLMQLYETMVLIRTAEQRASALFAAGEIPGFIHLSVGQEAVAAGVMSALTKADTIASNHRGHGHSLAKGIPLDKFFLELLAKRDGACRGRGGSMHVADVSVGMLGANGIVAAGIPIALGSALAHKVKKSGSIAAAFFGDGALAEGVFHESLNIAALKQLPMLFVCENNGWAEFSAGETQFAGDIHALAKSFGIPSMRLDGNDVDAVADGATVLVNDARAGRGPRLFECVTKRVHGHFEGDAQKYRSADEIATLSEFDPIGKAESRMKMLGVEADAIVAIKSDIEKRVSEAVTLAQNAAEPDFSDAIGGVYTPTGAHA
jgi:acetoin:2,6-dichlorophenolindophenol oxidoreductase subunit alpha